MKFLIWNNERRAWRGRCVNIYTTRREDAGRFEPDEADRIVASQGRRPHPDFLESWTMPVCIAVPDVASCMEAAHEITHGRQQAQTATRLADLERDLYEEEREKRIALERELAELKEAQA